MGRVARKYLVGVGTVNHCTWRGHGDSRVLETDAARAEFLRLLRKYKDRFGIQIHAYCLMGTHPHVLCRSTRDQQAFSAFWKAVNWSFATWYNRRTQGRGQVVMDRMRSPVVQDGRYQLAVMRYGDANPVRAGLARSPGAWRWSSYRHYAYGEPDDLIADAAEYLALGATALQRRTAYRHLFATKLPNPGDHIPLVIDERCIGDPEWIGLRRRQIGVDGPS